MKKLLLLTVIITCTLLAFGQDNKPSGLINLISPNNPTFDYSTSDSTIGIWKGTYKWNKLFSAKQIQHKVDSLATANSDTLDYYKLKTDSIAKTGYVPVDRYNKGLATKVPYTGATLNVDLGNYSITAKGQNLPISNGACVIPTITDNGNGSVTIGSGDYHLASDAAGHDSKTYTLTGGLFTIIDGSQNYIVADYNSGTPLVKLTTDVSIINETTVVPIYSIFRNGNYLHTQNWDALGLALANKVHQSIVKTQRYRRESGLSFSEYGTRNISVEQGRIWTGAVPITLDAVNTATDNLFVWYHSGGNWTSSVQTQYNNTQYDNGTNLATLTSNRFAVNWVFRGVESQKYVYIVLGTGDYTESQSIAATLPSIPTAISSHSVLIGKIIVQKNAATAFSKQSAFDTQFGLSPIQNHGDLTGRDATDSHPASAITNTPYSTTSATTIQLAINELTDEKEPTLTKGNLTAASTKVAVTGGTGAVIGSGTTVDVSEANLTLSNIGGSVTDSQVPNTITLDNITQVTNRSHTNLTDIGTNTHGAIDTFIGSKGQAGGIPSLDNGGKVPMSQLPSTLMIYKGTWSPLTNTPTLADGTGTSGWVYRASLSGTVNLGSGNIHFYAGDWVIYNGATWEKSSGGDYVVSVNSKQGVVVLSTSDISEGTNLYFTDARVSANIDVLANTSARHSAVTLGTANGLSLSTQQLSLGLSSASATGALSSTDWNTFNGKSNLTLGTTSTTAYQGDLGNTAYTDRFKWDGGSSGLTAATGRTSLGLGTAATSAVGDFIANGTTQQTASLNISGSANVGDMYSSVDNIFKARLVGVSGGYNYLQSLGVDNAPYSLAISSYSGTNIPEFKIFADNSNFTGAATFSGNVSAPTFSATGTIKGEIIDSQHSYWGGVFRSSVGTYADFSLLLANSSALMYVPHGSTTSVFPSDVRANQLQSTISNGYAPLTVASSTEVTNLNSNLLQGRNAAYFQTALTNPITGTGTAGYIPVFTGGTSLGNSIISQSGTTASVDGNLSASSRNAYYIGSKLMISDYGWGGDNNNVWLGGANNSTVTGTAAYEGNYNNAIGVNALRSNTTGYYNNAIGVSALYSNTTGYYNNAMGVNALYSNTTGYYNNAIGVNALLSNTTGSHNNAIGVGALRSNTTGSHNNAIGVNALLSNTTGYYNNAIGVDALGSNTTGNYNNAIGVSALLNNTTGYYNNAIGVDALYDLISGSNNSAFGYSSGRGITTGSNNTILGNNVVGLASGLTNNIILATGDGVIRSRFDGTNWSLSSLTGTETRLTTASASGQLGSLSYTDFIANNSIVTGTPWASMGYLTSASLNGYATQSWVNSNFTNYAGWIPAVNSVNGGQAVGSWNAFNFISGSGISFSLSGLNLTTTLDLGSLQSSANPTTSYYLPIVSGSNQAKITIGQLQTLIGGGNMVYPGSGIPVSTGSAWGTSLGTSGSGSVALTTSPSFTTPSLGVATATSINGLPLSMDSNYSLKLGLNSGNAGDRNTSIGIGSLNQVAGSSNTGVGGYTLSSTTSGYNNTVVGYSAMAQNTIGYNNTSVGLQALYNNSTGDSNTAIGYAAGSYTVVPSGTDYNNYTPINNVYIGNQTRAYVSGSTNEIVIGGQATGNGSNTVTIGGSSSTTTYLTPAIVVRPSSSAPSSPVAGMIYFNSSNGYFYGYDGTNWKQLDN